MMTNKPRKKGSGGSRKNAGRNESTDKKQTVRLGVETSKINNAGGEEDLKKYLYDCAEIFKTKH